MGGKRQDKFGKVIREKREDRQMDYCKSALVVEPEEPRLSLGSSFRG